MVRRLKLDELHIQCSCDHPKEPVLFDDGLWLHVTVDVEDTRALFGPLGFDAPGVYGLNAAASSVIMLPEQRLDRLVQRSKAEVLVLEPRQRETGSRSNPGQSFGRREKLVLAEAFIRTQSIQGIARTGSEYL
jgi:hypothetical protein